MKRLLLFAALLAGCDEDRALRVMFSNWSPGLQSVDLWMDGAKVARLNKATACATPVGAFDQSKLDALRLVKPAWCADNVRLRLASGQTYRFEVVGLDRYGRRLVSNSVTYQQP